MANITQEQAAQHHLNNAAERAHLPLRKVAECMETCGTTSFSFTVAGQTYTITKDK